MLTIEEQKQFVKDVKDYPENVCKDRWGWGRMDTFPNPGEYTIDECLEYG